MAGWRGLFTLGCEWKQEVSLDTVVHPRFAAVKPQNLYIMDNVFKFMGNFLAYPTLDQFPALAVVTKWSSELKCSQA